MQHIRAWRRSAGEAASECGNSPLPPDSASPLAPRRGTRSVPTSPCELSPGGLLGATRLTEVFASALRLDFLDKVDDGFRDTAGGGAGVAIPRRGGRSPGDLEDPEILLNRQGDAVLAEFIDRAGKKSLRASEVVTKVMVASLLVSEALGRSGDHASDLRRRCERLLLERVDHETGTVRLGDLMQAPREAGRGSGGRQPGAGMGRHRALLFKALADWHEVAPCALCRSKDGAATWNVVLVDGEPFVVDVMFDPGALYEEGSRKAEEYQKRLKQEAQPDASADEVSIGSGPGRRFGMGSGDVVGGAAAPSMQQHLGGRMVRPTWHVEPWEVEFDRRDRAGRGGFGEVFQGIWAGELVAVKEVRDATPTDGDICDFILEIALLSRLSHPNIVRFWRGCADVRGSRRTLLLVTEWMDRGVLSSFLHESQEPNLTFGQTLALATGIGRGVAYLHHVKILHLDLKSPNVLLDSLWQTKLCDFGLAKLREQTALHTTLRGVSPIWAPPELFDDRVGNSGVTEKADVYSFGIIMFELAARKLPFADVSQMQLPRVKAGGQLPQFPDGLVAELVELTTVCLAQKPAKRPAMTGVLERIKQIAESRGIDVHQEQAQMQRQGLHFGGGSGAASSVEQLRRAEAEKKRAESELARLCSVLQEEEKKVKLLQDKIIGRNARLGNASGDAVESAQKYEEKRQQRIQAFCEAQTQAVAGSKFRCGVCRKFFRGPEFVHKHVREKHSDEMVLLGILDDAAATGSASQVPSVTPNDVALRDAANAADQFFDADIAEESNPRLYTGRIAGSSVGPRSTITKGAFNLALQDAAEVGDVSRMQQCLLQSGAALNQRDVDGSTPLQLSAKGGHLNCVRYLVSNSVDVNAASESGFTALHFSAEEGRTETCDLLLQASATVDAKTSDKARTPLHLAAANGQRDTCALLLYYRAVVNLVDNDGETVLHNAARFGDRELCEVILSWGADVAARDNDGWSPLHEAARWGDGELVQSLLQRAADPQARSNDGESALHCAALHVVPGGSEIAELEVIEVLLAWKCSPNCQDYDGEAPLHIAVKTGDAELAGALLNHGADANIENHAGATPLDFAKRDEIRWLLRSHRGRKGTGAV